MIEITILLISIDCFVTSCLVLSLMLWRNKVNKKLEAQKFIANNALEGMKHLRDVRFEDLARDFHEMKDKMKKLEDYFREQCVKVMNKRDPLLLHFLRQFKSFATRIGCGPDDPKPKVEHILDKGVISEVYSYNTDKEAEDVRIRQEYDNLPNKY